MRRKLPSNCALDWRTLPTSSWGDRREDVDGRTRKEKVDDYEEEEREDEEGGERGEGEEEGKED